MKNKILRYQLMALHSTYVKHGQYSEAHSILYLLRCGRVRLRLGDADRTVELDLLKLGCDVGFAGRGYSITVYARKAY